MSGPRPRTVDGWPVAPGSRDIPLIIAHRGWSSDALENTLESFQLALDLGADGVELAELQSLDAGSWFDKKFEGARAPSLQEVFDALPPDFLINVELKVRGVGFKALASRVVETVRRHRRFAHTVVAGFNPLALAVVAWMDPDMGAFSPKLLETLHREGRPVMAWDVDTGGDLRPLSVMRLDAIVTDHPDGWVRQREEMLQERSARPSGVA